MTSRYHILIMRPKEDSGTVAQHAPSLKVARHLVSKIMPRLQEGYFYKIIKTS